MEFITRNLKQFGIKLVWDGYRVKAIAGDGLGYRELIEEHEATSLVVATEIMRDLERRYHSDCCGMALA